MSSKPRIRRGRPPAKIWWPTAPQFKKGSILAGYQVFPLTFCDAADGRWVNFKLVHMGTRGLPGGTNFALGYNVKERRLQRSRELKRLLVNTPGQLLHRGYQVPEDYEAKVESALLQMLDFYVTKCDNGEADWPARYVPKGQR